MSAISWTCVFCVYIIPISSLSANFTRPFGNDVATTNPIIRTTGSSSRIRCGLDCNQEPDCLGYNLREACVTGDCCQLTRGITRPVDTADTPGMVYYAKKFHTPPPRDCYDVRVNGQTSSGVAVVYPEGRLQYQVFCDLSTSGEWNILLRRQDGSENFDRPWTDYKTGFGDKDNEFWAGLDLMHLLTSDPGVTYRVRVDLESYQGAVSYAEYDLFVVDSEADKYRLHVGAFSGTAGDALSYHDNTPFSTPDVDNDAKSLYSCADHYHSGWWYKGCSDARLTGLYGENIPDAKLGGTTFYQGIMWYYDPNKHPKYVELKVRRN